MIGDRIKCLWLGTDGYVSCADKNHLSGYFTKSELIEMKEAIDKTLVYYDEEKITDDFIRNQDMIEMFNENKRIEERNNVVNKKKSDDLYLILDEDENILKIGRSKNVKSRLNQLKVASSHNLKLLYVVDGKGYMEEEVHGIFKEQRINGEWFRNDGKIIGYFKAFLI